METEMTDAEIEAKASEMMAKVNEAVRNAKQMLWDYAEANVEEGYQAAFVIDAAMTITEGALRATASSLDKYGLGAKAEAEMAMQCFGEMIIPQIVMLTEGLAKLSSDDENETKH